MFELAQRSKEMEEKENHIKHRDFKSARSERILVFLFFYCPILTVAPAAASTITAHFKDFSLAPDYYDYVVTGDLGSVGSKILLDLLAEKGIDLNQKHVDCGVKIFDSEKQGTGAGGSGCGCSAVTLTGYFLREMLKGNIRKILFIPTGALLSTVSFNEGQTVPGIAHAVAIEAFKKEN